MSSQREIRAMIAANEQILRNQGDLRRHDGRYVSDRLQELYLLTKCVVCDRELALDDLTNACKECRELEQHREQYVDDY